MNLYCYAHFIGFRGPKKKIFVAMHFSFDEVSLKSDVKLIVIIF